MVYMFDVKRKEGMTCLETSCRQVTGPAFLLQLDAIFSRHNYHR